MTEETLKYFKGKELAAEVWWKKYRNEKLKEKEPKNMWDRMANSFARIEQRYKNEDKQFSDEEYKSLSNYYKKRKDLTFEKIYGLFENFKYIIPQGSVMASLGTPQIASLSNCLVAGEVEDSYGGIMYIDEYLVQAMKRRMGVGIDLSKLRPTNALTNNAAKTSTGVISFMNRFSNTTREVAQSGRRGALMISMDIRHPDILEFIKIKRDLTKITGANISIKLNDEFMKAVENDEDYILRFPVDLDLKETWGIKDIELNKLYAVKSGYVKYIKAKELWNEIIKSAHNVAEPGLMYWNRMIDYAPDGVYDQFKAITTNPCFTGDMKILTPTGEKTFEELEDKETDLVNKNGDIVQGKVWSSGIKRIYEIKFWNKEPITCTEDHTFLTIENKEVKAINLKGERLMPFYKMNTEVSEFTKLGFIQGDGNLTRLNSTSHLGLEINIGKDDRDIAELFEIEYKEGKVAYYTKGYNLLLKNLKFQAKVLPERGLPKTISEWEDKDVLMFLKGIFSANGSIIKGHRVSLKSTCYNLIEDIKNILYKHNITSYITTNKAKEVKFSNGNYLCKESYDLNISTFKDVKTFAEKIGFVQKYKTEALEELLLQKAPLVKSVEYTGRRQKVYDFNLKDSIHWGIVEGVVAHNCSEIGMGANDACRLIAVNLFSFVDNPFTEKAKFNHKKFYQYNYEAMRLSDDLVDLEAEYIDRILKKIENDPESWEIKKREYDIWKKIKATALSSRRTGLGFTALGDTLAALGLKYDSDEALEEVERIMYTKMESELDSTIDMAIERGTFKGWDSYKEFNGEYSSDFYIFIMKKYSEQALRMAKHGRRNISWSTVAPTGSLSILADTTSGIEPLFMPFYIRRKKIDSENEDIKADFIDDVGDKWKEYAVIHGKFKEWIKLKYPSLNIENLKEKDLQKLFTESPWYRSTANDINWNKRVEMQALIQKYITHSISSTVNLPNDVSEEEVSNIYKKAWELGIKGITVYRDGSRSGVLVSQKSDKNETKFEYKDAFKRPKEIEGEVTTIQVAGKKISVYVGLIEKNPYEVFLMNGTTKNRKGKIIKEGSGKYIFSSEGHKDKIITNVTPEQEFIGRLTSGALRHGMHPKYIIKIAEKAGIGILDFTGALKKALAKYLKSKDITDKTCPSCGDNNLVYEEGCKVCKSCGWSACG